MLKNKPNILSLYDFVEIEKAMPESKASVLVVDDNPDNLRTLSTILQREGYTVRKAISGAMALATIRSQHPDLILLDIRMPDMDGYEVCATLQASNETRQIPIIFLSALDDVADKIKAFNTGGADYITKPFQSEEVLVRIRHQLTIREQQKQLIEQRNQLSQLYQQVQHLNTHLEEQVQHRTAELQQALMFERTLKSITDKVRDFLDETQLLQTAVEELAKALQARGCDAVLSNGDQTVSILRYRDGESSQHVDRSQVLQYSDLPDLYRQLWQEIDCAFCQLTTSELENDAAILVCPIIDDRNVLGSLWVFKSLSSEFGQQEINLVRQVANQCAIALRQARLYQAAQTQLRELQKLNQLKDEFLSTISHELRSPIANIKMVINLFIATINKEPHLLAASTYTEENHNKIGQYLEILQDECERELRLVEDLLSLQYLEAGNYPLDLTPIALDISILNILEPFETRIRNQQQILQVNLSPTMPLVISDSFCFNRILTELVNNACKYTPPGGTIAFSTYIENDQICLSVSNTGIEIPLEELDKIFDKFYRISSDDPWRYEGTGLGLALVKKLVEHIKGSIQVESANGKTCFTVKLPLKQMQ